MNSIWNLKLDINRMSPEVLSKSFGDSYETPVEIGLRNSDIPTSLRCNGNSTEPCGIEDTSILSNSPLQLYNRHSLSSYRKTGINHKDNRLLASGALENHSGELLWEKIYDLVEITGGVGQAALPEAPALCEPP